MHAAATLALRPSSWIGLALLVSPLASTGAGVGAAIAYSDLALGVAVLLAGIGLLRGRGLRLARTVPAAAFWMLGLVSVVTALVAQNFPADLVDGVRFLELFCLAPIAVMLALRTRLDAVVVLGSLIGLALLEGALGVLQALTGTGAEIGGEAVRAVGTFGAYNIAALASLAGLALVVCLALGVVLPAPHRWWTLVAAGFLTLPLAFSLSRGAWVAAAVAAVVVVSRGRPVRLVATAVSVALAAALVLPVVIASGTGLGDRVASLVTADSEPDQSVIDRLALWKAAREMALDHPLTGVGPGGFADRRDAYADLSLLGSSDISFGGVFERVGLESPHNFYLLVASERGLVAASLFVLVFALLLARGLVRSARPRSDASTAVALAGVGTLAFTVVLLISGDLGGPGSIFVAASVGLAGWAAADVDLLPSGPLRGGAVDAGADAAPPGRPALVTAGDGTR